MRSLCPVRGLERPITRPAVTENGHSVADVHQPVPPPSRAPRPLLCHKELERLRDTMTLAGHRDEGEALLDDARRHAEYLERCASEAELVLHGDLGAASRLWLLLNHSIDVPHPLPASIVREIAGNARRDAPKTVDGEALLRLVAGVVRAANTPSEAEAMLASLDALLEPLFVLELAAVGAERASAGDTQALKTVVTSRFAPEWRRALGLAPDPVLKDPPSAGSPVMDKDRIPFDVGSWRDPAVAPKHGQWDLLWPCVGKTRLAMSEIDRFGPRYTIESVSIQHRTRARRRTEACPGQTITIRGKNFGPMGRVAFPRPEPDDPAFLLGGPDSGVLIGVEATRWTDTEIDVVVPPWATVGELHLNAFTRHADLCSIIDVYRLGNTILFQGGLAGVYKVYIAGHELDPEGKPPFNLAPGDSVALTWRASSGPSVRVKAQLIDGTTVLWEQSGLGGYGGVVLTVPDSDPHQPRMVRLVLSATSKCGSTQPLSIPVSLSVPPTLTIQYVEVTQGVQGDLADVLAGRGMPTIAYKDTAVRVHMNCDRGGWWFNKLDRITGSLKVDGRPLSPTNVRVIVPDRGFAGISGLSNPNFTNDTLNFTIPAAWLTPGAHTLTLRLVCDDQSGRIELSQNFSWSWVAKSPLRVRAVYMSLYGADEFMLDYTRRALDYLPTTLADIGIAAPRWLTHTYNLGQRSGWSDLLDDLEDAWDDADEDSGVRWLGIVPASERFLGMSLALQGISGTPGIAALAMGDRPEIGAHELGHTYGLHHINLPIGVPDDPYDSADSGGMLRRPPFDVRSGRAIPLPAGDLMSYFEPIRPGISTWMRLFLNT